MAAELSVFILILVHCNDTTHVTKYLNHKMQVSFILIEGIYGIHIYLKVLQTEEAETLSVSTPLYFLGI